MKNLTNQKKQLIRKICKYYFDSLVTEEKLDRFSKVKTKRLYNLIAKYIVLGGKLSPKYKIKFHFKADPNDKKYLNSSRLYLEIPYVSHFSFKTIVEDIGKGKLELEPIEHLSKDDMNKISKLSKEFIALQKLNDKNYRNYERIFSKLTNIKKPSSRDKTIAFMNLVLSILNSNEEK